MKKLLIILFILLFATPAVAVLIGDVDTGNLNPTTLIKVLDVPSKQGLQMKSAAFRYSTEIRVVIAVVSFNPLKGRWEYESIRYLKSSQLHYYNWDATLVEYTPSEIPTELEGLWVMELKQLVDGI